MKLFALLLLGIVSQGFADFTSTDGTPVSATMTANGGNGVTSLIGFSVGNVITTGGGGLSNPTSGTPVSATMTANGGNGVTSLIGFSAGPVITTGGGGLSTPTSKAIQDALTTAQLTHAIHHGSKAGEAIAAAAQAGLMYKLLMDQGVMDLFRRKEMDKSLEIMNKKIEALQKEVKTGKMSPAELAAIKSAVEEAYAKNSKFDAPKDKEVAPNSPVSSRERSAALEASPSAGNQTANRDFQKAIQSDEKQLPQDIAQLAPKTSPELQSGKTSPESGAPTKATSDLGKGPMNGIMGGSPWLGGAGWNSTGQTPFHPQVVLNVSSDNNSASNNRNQSRSSDSREENTGASMGFAGGMDGLYPQEELPMNQQHYLGLEEMSGEGEASLLEGSSHPKTWLGSVFGHLLEPIKVQRSPFSKEIYNQEGIHPLVLLGLFVGALALGFRLNRGKKTPLVVPEVMVGREETPPISRSTAVVIPMRRADRRYQPRV